MGDRREHHAAGLAERRRNGLRPDAAGARFEAQPALPIDVSERERRGGLAVECVQLDPELGAPCGQPLAFLRPGAGQKRDAVPEPRGRRGRVHRRAPDTPFGIALELVACRVPDRDEIKH